MPLVRTHNIRSDPILPMHRQNRKIQPQNRFCEPSRKTIVLIERLYCTIPQSLRASSLYTREPLPRPISAREPPIGAQYNDPPLFSITAKRHRILYLISGSCPLSAAFPLCRQQGPDHDGKQRTQKHPGQSPEAVACVQSQQRGQRVEP